jgi:DNA-binding NarL/FixJ family response regulator
VVAEAENGAVALRLLQEKRPQVAVLDVDMPEVDGFEVVRTARKQQIGVEVVFLTMHKDEDVLNEALSLGVRGFVVKDSAVNDITESIRAVVAGQFYISLLSKTGKTPPSRVESRGLSCPESRY